MSRKGVGVRRTTRLIIFLEEGWKTTAEILQHLRVVEPGLHKATLRSLRNWISAAGLEVEERRDPDDHTLGAPVKQYRLARQLGRRIESDTGEEVFDRLIDHLKQLSGPSHRVLLSVAERLLELEGGEVNQSR